MEIAEPLSYMSDGEAWPYGSEAVPEKGRERIGRRGAGWPRTKVDYRRGTQMARSCTSLMSHHALVSPTGR
eukprot:5446901-Pleurochrysis_carterae.AAC.1